MSALSAPVLALLFATPLAIAIGQLLFKLTSGRISETNGGYSQIFIDPVFLLAIAIYAGATLTWIYVLRQVPLSYAYSFMALTFVFVPLLAWFFVGEQITWRYGLGAALIISGLAVVQG